MGEGAGDLAIKGEGKGDLARRGEANFGWRATCQLGKGTQPPWEGDLAAKGGGTWPAGEIGIFSSE